MTFELRKLLLAGYYIVLGVSVLLSTVIVPFQLAEKASVEYMNSRLSELRRETGATYLDEKSDAVANIIRSGAEVDKVNFKELSGRFGLLSAFVAIILTLYLPFTRLSDFIWMGIGYSVLFGLGALNSESYMATLLLIFAAYFLKKRRAKDQ